MSLDRYDVEGASQAEALPGASLDAFPDFVVSDVILEEKSVVRHVLETLWVDAFLGVLEECLDQGNAFNQLE